MPISSLELVKFPNRVFVETGSYMGDGIKAALNAGFEEVYSVDISPVQYDYCCNLFKDDKRVHLYLEDCGTWLDKILNQINEPCTIYLDANGWKDETEHPFNSAIKALIRHGRKDHTILVDDINHAGLPFEEIQRTIASSYVAEQLYKINASYPIYVIDSHSQDLKHTYIAWVAVAQPPQ